MIYVKSVLAGIAAMIAAALVIALYLLWRMYKLVMSVPDNWGGYVDLHWHTWPVFCTVLLVFAAGFWWQYRRAR